MIIYDTHTCILLFSRADVTKLPLSTSIYVQQEYVQQE